MGARRDRGDLQGYPHHKEGHPAPGDGVGTVQRPPYHVRLRHEGKNSRLETRSVDVDACWCGKTRARAGEAIAWF